MAAHGITNPCAGTEGGAPAAIDIVIDGQNFYGYPTYCVVCPDRTLYFDICWPPTEDCFYPYFEMCTPAIAASFSSDISEVCVEGVVQFDDLSVGDITSWAWTFEGGDPATSSEQNPMVTYNTTGTWDVSLTVSGGTGSDTYSIEDYMDVFDLPVVTLEAFPVIGYDWEPFELTGGMPEGGDYSGPGIEGNIFDPVAAGLGTHTIIYSYINENGCDDFAQQELEVVSFVGINELGKEIVYISPNPASEVVNIKSALQIIHLDVFNHSGQLVYNADASSTTYNLSVGSFESGLYLFRVTTAEGTTTKRIVIN